MNKLLDVTNKQALRGNVLKICNEANPIGAGTNIILSVVRKHGLDINNDEIEEAGAYLEGKGLIKIETVENKPLNIKRIIYHITPEGIDVLEGTKAVDGIELGD